MERSIQVDGVCIALVIGSADGPPDFLTAQALAGMIRAERDALAGRVAELDQLLADVQPFLAPTHTHTI